MKNFVLLACLAFAFVQCDSEKIKPKKALPITILSEQIEPYAYTAKDTVYSVNTSFTSSQSITALYIAHLQTADFVHKDSIVVHLDSNQKVTSQIIFTQAKVSARNEPTITSKLKIIESNK